MNYLRKPTLLTLTAVIIGMFMMSGCNTMRGLGQDTEQVGEEIQQATR